MGHLSIFDQLQPQKSLPGGGLFYGLQQRIFQKKKIQKNKTKKVLVAATCKFDKSIATFFFGTKWKTFLWVAT